jgi:hypothetical protein
MKCRGIKYDNLFMKKLNKIYDLEGRNKAIVLFKFFAALLITYSHLGLLFPKLGGLVTGGAIGDGLFVFCSWFTLFLGRDGGFLNWYKRRVSCINTNHKD